VESGFKHYSFSLQVSGSRSTRSLECHETGLDPVMKCWSPFFSKCLDHVDKSLVISQADKLHVVQKQHRPKTAPTIASPRLSKHRRQVFHGQDHRETGQSVLDKLDNQAEIVLRAVIIFPRCRMAFGTSICAVRFKKHGVFGLQINPKRVGMQQGSFQQSHENPHVSFLALLRFSDRAFEGRRYNACRL
jgi:hypothetical protein